MRRLVALDRDGTVIQERPYLSDPGQVVLLPNAVEGLRCLQREGFRLVLVSNQSGIGRGLFGLDVVQRVNERLFDLLTRQGVRLDGAYICPHAPWQGCPCRKPNTGLLEQAAREFAVAPDEAFVVGDRGCDVEMGRRAGVRTLLVRTGWGRSTEEEGEVGPDYVVDDLLAAASVIVACAARTVVGV